MSLHQILLQPTDVLFFRDGRPMSGSLAGHTAAWPLPDVTNHALHAALHRADLGEVHGHDHINTSGKHTEKDVRKFGSLVTAGPFPVNSAGQWLFPRPKDTQLNGSVLVTHQPLASLTAAGNDDPWVNSSLPDPLDYAVTNTKPPSKEAGGEPWISQAAFKAYLGDQEFNPKADDGSHYLRDADLADTEHSIGIEIDPATGTTGQADAKGKIYSAHYLRLREGFRLGLFAEAMDKGKDKSAAKLDLLKNLLNGHREQILVGGQQRICTADRRDVANDLPLPRGLTQRTDFKPLPHGKIAVKWVLLTPSIWPEIRDRDAQGCQIKDRNDHPIQKHGGGWLPNWVAEAECTFAGETVESGGVLLLDGPGREKAHRKNLTPGKRIRAKLVAAIVPKPIPVTGWALPNGTDRTEGGAKSTHLAVPAGAVYYFEANSPEDAVKLAAALNWHGSEAKPTTIKNRRSTLLGEKGFGLGVCGTWDFTKDVIA